MRANEAQFRAGLSQHAVQEQLALPVSPKQCDEAVCAICYDVVEQVADLPCRCKVAYCMRCWDRALAESFRKCSIALCPTCREPVRVDFDSGQGCLRFSREMEFSWPERPLGHSAVEYFEHTLARITEQVRPAQIRLLMEYGATVNARVVEGGASGKRLEGPESQQRGGARSSERPGVSGPAPGAPP